MLDRINQIESYVFSIITDVNSHWPCNVRNVEKLAPIERTRFEGPTQGFNSEPHLPSQAPVDKTQAPSCLKLLR